MGGKLSDGMRDLLLALYGAIEAEGGEDPDENEDFDRGYATGLEMALLQIDQLLNADVEPDAAWIEEGLKRFRDADAARRAALAASTLPGGAR